ncbi:EhbH [Methanobacterium sp.]|uniref:EhbH n=1 Tax=Methanobacterium sp. TaxID=2164 RepID=UPI001DC93C18|nr:EhbH [Methanobacterium sp.]MBI4813727.1 EhbH [Methanobacterium sp.]MBI5459512.1 EhbH [Methanobacterium sp.]MDY9923836.1 EhbH [Methanobacterium sp.]
MSEGIRKLIMGFSIFIFAVTIFQSTYHFKQMIYPGISYIYNYVGPNIAPNMVTIVVFDWRGYDTLGEALILVTAVIAVLLVFGRGRTQLGGK